VGDEALQRTFDPAGEAIAIPTADHGVEVGDRLSRLDEVGDAGFDRSHDDRLRLAEVVAANCHQASDGAGRGYARQHLRIRLFGAAPPRRLFADHPQGSAEALVLEFAPETGGVPRSAIPLRVQPGKMEFRRTFPCAEDVGALAAGNGADHYAAVAGVLGDPPQRAARLDLQHDGGVRLLAPQIALALQALGRGQQLGVDHLRADGGADLAHRPTHRVEEGPVGVLHEVPAIRNLDRIGQSAAQSQPARPIARCSTGSAAPFSNKDSCVSRMIVGGTALPA